jgi:hypothetical protein
MDRIMLMRTDVHDFRRDERGRQMRMAVSVEALVKTNTIKI